MNDSAFTTICTAGTLGEADQLVACLRAAGLHPVDLSTAGHFSLAGADIEYPIQVPADEAAAAKEFLASSESPSDDSKNV